MEKISTGKSPVQPPREPLKDPYAEAFFQELVAQIIEKRQVAGQKHGFIDSVEFLAVSSIENDRKTNKKTTEKRLSELRTNLETLRSIETEILRALTKGEEIIPVRTARVRVDFPFKHAAITQGGALYDAIMAIYGSRYPDLDAKQINGMIETEQGGFMLQIQMHKGGGFRIGSIEIVKKFPPEDPWESDDDTEPPTRANTSETAPK